MSRGAWSGEIGKLQYYRMLRFWGGGSAYVVWEGCSWSGGGGWSGKLSSLLVIWVPTTRFASKARGSSLRCEAVYVCLLPPSHKAMADKR